MSCFYTKIKPYITKKNVFAGGYLLLLAVYLSRLFLDTTMWYLGWAPHNYLLFVKLCAICILAKVVFYDKWTFKEAIVGIGFVITCFLVYRKTGYREVLDLAVLMIGAKGISVKDIVKIYFMTGSYLLVLTIIASVIGIIPDLMYYKDEIYVRHSFGVVYPTDFAAHVFGLILAFCYLKQEHLNYINVASFFVIAILLYVSCNAETSVICIVFVALLTLFYILCKSQKKDHVLQLSTSFADVLSIAAIPVFAVFSLLVTLFYSQGNRWLERLNNLISNRLRLAQDAFNELGVSPFGKLYIMWGGGRAEGNPPAYNFIDNSYMNILLRYGIVLSVFILFFLVWIAWKNNKQKKQLLISGMFCVMALHSFMEHHLVEPTYFFFILFFFASYQKEDEMLYEIKADKADVGIDMFSIGMLMALGMTSVFSLTIDFNHISSIAAIVLTIIFFIIFSFFIYKKISKCQYVCFVICSVVFAMAFQLISGMQNTISALGFQENLAHKPVFIGIFLLTVLLPLMGKYMLKKRNYLISVLTVTIAAGIMAGCSRKNTANLVKEAEEVEHIIQQIELENKGRKINYAADENAYLYYLKSGIRVKAGQPDRTKRTVYFAHGKDQDPNFLYYTYYYIPIKEDLGYYSNIGNV